ncbi:MAG: MoxR family ATPase [Clostridia bacterium]|nr:MoxR family ATPase [Clostridia bacterium]
MVTEKDLKDFSDKCSRVFEQIGRDMVGQRDIIESAVVAMIAGGNVLLEGVPGVGKTRLVRSLGRVFGLPFSRIQFTPDLMPSDVTGTNVIEKDERGNSVYRFQPGPVFSNIVLADEINRATPKTQSALLEAMQEHIVSIAGEDHRLSEPFFVLATQNPIEQEGTYPLPEAQIDRFMLKLLVPFPSVDELRRIVLMTQQSMEETSERVLSAGELLAMRETAREIPVIDEVVDFTMRLVAATHPDSDQPSETAKRYIRMGASPRAAQALITGAKVRALIGGRYNVSLKDIHALAYPVLRHRVKLNFDAVAERKTPDELIAAMLGELTRRPKSPVFGKR